MKYWHEAFHWMLLIVLSIAGLFMAWNWDGSPFSEYFTTAPIVYLALVLIMLKAAHLEGAHDALKFPRPINHRSSAILRIALLLAIYFGWNFIEVFGLIRSIVISAGGLAAFSFYFCIRYNTIRGLPWNYVGKTALYDRLLGQWKWPMELLLFTVSSILAFL